MAGIEAEKRPWGRAALLLALLGPFFFASYGFATWYTSRLVDVPSVVFTWERLIPFLPWTIVPYWSIDLFYALSFFICVSRAELHTHAKRLFAAQLISIGGFLLFPLRFTFERPPVEGIFGQMFAALEQFDKPFNQAPSLHISLLVILWLRYAAHLGRTGRLVLHVWFALIGLSVLTTWQHHFIDLPTGFAAGALCVALFPDRPGVRQRDGKRFRLALFYFAGATFLGFLAYLLGRLDPIGLWFFWPAISLAIVAIIYLRGRQGGFGKSQGRLFWPLAVVLAPYLLGAFINSRLWTRRFPDPVEVAEGVWLGRLPTFRENEKFKSLVDCAAELPLNPAGVDYRALPMLDLLVPEQEQLIEVAEAIETSQRPTLVFCALGFSRSALAIAVWLVRSGRAADGAEALETMSRARPKIVLGSAHLAALLGSCAERTKAEIDDELART